jgi:metal-responsive CopG/Arc/MetJ family transcriptional regulator
MKERETDMRTNVILPESLWEEAKMRAMKDRVPLTEVVRRALRQYLDKKEPKNRRQTR